MRRGLRLLLISGGVVASLGGLGYGYLLHYPAPRVPPLGTPVRAATLHVGDLDRSYLLYAPARLPSNPALVLALHGATSTAEQMREATGYGLERLAEAQGFLIAYPQGFERHWNDCRKKATYSAKQLAVEDVRFLRELVRHLHATRGADTSRVYAVGYSNGGHLAYRLALEAPDLARAVAVVAANLPTDDNSDCTPVPGRTPILILNGTEDPINPFAGGRVTIFGFSDRGTVRSAVESARYFALRNGAVAAPVVEPAPRGRGPGPFAERSAWMTAAGEEVVVLYTIHGGGHTLPQPGVRFPRILGRTYQGLDGPAEIWRFFAAHGGS